MALLLYCPDLCCKFSSERKIYFECNIICAEFLSIIYICILFGDIIVKKERVKMSLTDLIPATLSDQTRTRISTFISHGFCYLRLEVNVCFVDHHCFNFLFKSFFLKSDSTHHFFGNACTKSGSLRLSQFSGCWLILYVYIFMSFDFPFGRLFGVR